MKDVTYRLSDVVGKNVFAGKRGIYVYKVDKKGKRYKFATIPKFSLIGQLEKYQILDPKQVGKPKETWVLFFKGGGFVFLPKGEKDLIDVSKFAAQGIKTDEDQIAENQDKYNLSPITAAVDTIKQTVSKYPALLYIAAGLLIYKMSKNG